MSEGVCSEEAEMDDQLEAVAESRGHRFPVELIVHFAAHATSGRHCCRDLVEM